MDYKVMGVEKRALSIQAQLRFRQFPSLGSLAAVAFDA